MLELELAALAVDAHDPTMLATWWQRILGGEVDADSEGDATLYTDSLSIDFCAVPEKKSVKNRLHLDLRSDNFDDAVDQAVDLGATLADDIYDGDSWQVLRDPEGNEFCILRPEDD